MRWVVFDFDGTILDTLAIVRTAEHDLRRRYNVSFDVETARSLGLRALIRESGVPWYRVPKIAAELKREFSTILRNDAVVVEGMVSVIDVLAKKYQLAILSSNSEETINVVLQRYGLEKYFSVVIGGASMFGKADVLRLFLKNVACAPSEVVYVGDEDRDVLAAKKVGVRCVGVSWGMNTAERLRKVGAVVVDTPAELIGAIEP